MKTYNIQFSNGELIIEYYGFLYQNNSSSVNIIYGFGSNWDTTQIRQMTKTKNGFSIGINVENIDENIINFCFANENDEWDNNYNNDYTVIIINTSSAGNVQDSDEKNLENIIDEGIEDNSEEKIENSNIEDVNEENVEETNLEDSDEENVEESNIEDLAEEEVEKASIEDSDEEDVGETSIEDSVEENVEEASIEDSAGEEVGENNIEDSTEEEIEKASIDDSAKEEIEEGIVENLAEEHIKEENNIENEYIKDNGVLLISEVQNKVLLPYTAEEIMKILNSENNSYSSVEDVINSVYTKPLDKYKYLAISRFKEAVELVTKRENMSLMDGMNLGNELFGNKYLHPAVISACKNLDELNVYLDCLEKNELDEFKVFEIKYEMYPMVKKESTSNYFFEKLKRSFYELFFQKKGEH